MVRNDIYMPDTAAATDAEILAGSVEGFDNYNNFDTTSNTYELVASNTNEQQLQGPQYQAQYDGTTCNQAGPVTGPQYQTQYDGTIGNQIFFVTGPQYQTQYAGATGNQVVPVPASPSSVLPQSHEQPAYSYPQPNTAFAPIPAYRQAPAPGYGMVNGNVPFQGRLSMSNSSQRQQPPSTVQYVSPQVANVMALLGDPRVRKEFQAVYWSTPVPGQPQTNYNEFAGHANQVFYAQAPSQAQQLPGPNLTSGPHVQTQDRLEEMCEVASPTFDAQRISHDRKLRKKRHPTTDPANFYKDPLPPVENWGRTTSGRYVFKYTPDGVWEDSLVFSDKELQIYVNNIHRQNRRLTIFVQHAPSQMKDRLKPCGNKCRWKNCPDPKKTIKSGWLRVAFDEFPELTKSGKKDPFKVAGSMHLYCFEQCFDAAELARKGLLKADKRDLPKESRNPMALTRDTDTNIIEQAFNPWVAENSNIGPVAIPREHSDSLSHRLMDHHIRNQATTRQSVRTQRNASKDPNAKKTSDFHLGDLKFYVDRSLLQTRRGRGYKARQAKAYQDESSDDEGLMESPTENPNSSGYIECNLQIPECVTVAENLAEENTSITVATGPQTDINLLAAAMDYSYPSHDLPATGETPPNNFPWLVSSPGDDAWADLVNDAIDPALLAEPICIDMEPAKDALEQEAVASVTHTRLPTPQSEPNVGDSIEVKEQKSPAKKRKREDDDDDSLFGSPTSVKSKDSVSSRSSKRRCTASSEPSRSPRTRGLRTPPGHQPRSPRVAALRSPRKDSLRSARRSL